MDVSVNYLAILVCGLAAMALGTAWYGPLFGKEWMRMTGKTAADMEKGKKGMGKTYALGFLGAVITAYVLAHFLALLNVTDLSGALTLAFWAWLGFQMTIELGSVLWDGKPWKLFAITAGYDLVNLSVMAAILVSLS